MMHFQLMHESLARFSESFASFLYGLNVNAFCVDFPEVRKDVGVLRLYQSDCPCRHRFQNPSEEQNSKRSRLVSSVKVSIRQEIADAWLHSWCTDLRRARPGNRNDIHVSRAHKSMEISTDQC